MRVLQIFREINGVIAVLLAAAYFYQGIYLLIGLVRRKPRPLPEPARLHRFAAVICARNEEAVVADLIRSLKAQDYPGELLDIYLLADNCTDGTAETARRAGAEVFERFDTAHVGKGYALDALFKQLPDRGYAGYFVFDADNLVDPGFVREMNRVYDSGYEIVTCYRNSRNFGDNWITAGYSIWFLREARFLNHPRMLLGNSCAVSGTGFLISDKVIRENGGWPFYLLTEDIQFSVDCALKGRKIGYCGSAVVYDEQPTSFRQSWTQRMRWSKGFFQISAKYLLPLMKGAAAGKGRRMSCYDLLMTVAPATLLSLASGVLSLCAVSACLTLPPALASAMAWELCREFAHALTGSYFGMFLCGALTVLSERRRIREPNWRKIVYLPLFPIFMATYVPVTLAALFCKVEWKPIRHVGDGKNRLCAVKSSSARAAVLPAGDSGERGAYEMREN